MRTYYKVRKNKRLLREYYKDLLVKKQIKAEAKII